jgi:hypothetical protein
MNGSGFVVAAVMAWSIFTAAASGQTKTSVDKL